MTEARSNRIYRFFLKLLPSDFRSEFGSDMEAAFREQSREARQEGKSGLALLGRTLLDLLRVGPSEHWQMFRQDAGYALRLMRKNLGFTTVALVTLALGVGANTAIFSVINAILLRPMPYADPQQLVVLHAYTPKAGRQIGFSPTELSDYRQQSKTMTDLAEIHVMNFTLLGGEQAERVKSGVVSWNFFDLFGVKPLLGRTFTPADEEMGAPAVLMLSYEFWQKVEHGDPDIVGRKFEMNDRVHTVIGVLPPVPQYPRENDVYMPTSACPSRSSERARNDRDAFRFLSVFGRLRPRATLQQAGAETAAIAGRLQAQYPKSYPAPMGYTAGVVNLQQEITHQARPVLLVLLGAAAFVLLVACANVANFTMARLAQREQELSLRAAMGAGQSRILRQLLTESTLMGLLSAVLGIAMAAASMKLLINFTARLTPRAHEISMDGRVLLFGVAAALLTSLVAGSILAFSSQDRLGAGMKESGRQLSAGMRRARMRNVLIVAQVAFSFVLLIGAGLMLRSLQKLESVDPGFVPQQVLSMDLEMPFPKYNSDVSQRKFSTEARQKLAALPGVMNVALASSFPLDSGGMGGMGTHYEVEGHPTPKGLRPAQSDLKTVTEEYFRTLGIPLIEGREFLPTDDEKAPDVIVINQTLARHIVPGEDPIGKRLTNDGGKTWNTIVGIVGDTREYSLDRKPTDIIYAPQQQTSPLIASLVLRTAGDPAGLARAAQKAIGEVDPTVAVSDVQSLEEVKHDTLNSPRTLSNLLALFGGLALLIAATGIGGILALSVSQRMHEIGVRMALGAQPGSVLSMILRQGMVLVVAGLAIGAGVAAVATRSIQSMLFEVAPRDPATFAFTGGVLAAAALLACYVPARKATRIDPLVALRHE